MKTYFWWQWRVTRRVVPVLVLFLIVVGGAVFLFIRSLHQQQRYIAQYKADIQFNIVRRRKKSDAEDKRLNTWILPQLRNEESALQSPTQYAAGFARSLTILVHPTPSDGQPAGLRKQFSALVIPWTTAFGGQEINTTVTELALVKKRHITPMYPARLLLNEQSAQYFTESSASYQRYVQKVGQRFYERAWYFLQELIRQNGGLILGGIISCILAWRYALQIHAGSRNSIIFTALGVAPIKQYWASLLFNTIAAFLFVVTSVSLFLLLSAWCNGWGALNYPMLTWRGNAVMYSHVFINLEILLGGEVLLFLGSILFSLSFTHLLSVVVKQPLAVLLATLSLWGIPLVAPNWRWAPWTYFNFSRVADGYTKVFFQTYDVVSGMAVLLVWASLLSVLGAIWLILGERRHG